VFFLISIEAIGAGCSLSSRDFREVSFGVDTFAYLYDLQIATAHAVTV
jgi:hypothetical protein